MDPGSSSEGRPRIHGGSAADELATLGFDPRRALDFSVNVNPYGPCQAVLEAIRQAPVHLYPDPTAKAVRQAISERTGAPAEAIVFGNGAAELLWCAARVLLSSRCSALVVEPAFSEFRAAVEAHGVNLASWRARTEEGLRVDFDEVAKAAREAAVSVVYLAAPSTPAGVEVPLTGVAGLARDLPDAIVLLDESFLSLSDQSDEARLPLPGNVVRVRSLTKEHAIPGIRAGYLIGSIALARAMEAARPAWSTSSIAQAATLAALEADEFVRASREKLRVDRMATLALLTGLGARPLPSVAPYLAFEVKEAAALRRRLLVHGVVVRDCASFGLEGFVRVAARPQAERTRLLAALEKELS
jgi:histidinol-phosphate/aromatic aminotransferase/cobyric acid decarboxylase-like protein